MQVAFVVTDKPSIPKAVKPAFEAVVVLTDAICKRHLNEEWCMLSRKLAAALARKRPSPLGGGRPQVWAAGILHALGMVNFLFDRSQKPSIDAKELCTAFDVSQSAMAGKSGLIRKMFQMYQMDPSWTLPSKLAMNPLVWMITVNGFAIDARYAPPEIQYEAYQRGLIPFIPSGEKHK
jgi:hypothetical protein